MKKIKIKGIVVFIFALALLLGSCSDEDYFITESIPASVKIEMSTYDYLASKPLQFSHFVEIIDLTNSKSLVNSPNVTVLVPQNASIDEFVLENDKNAISDFTSAQLSSLLKKYIINQKITTTLLKENEMQIPNLFGEQLIVSLKRDVWKGVANAGPAYLSINNLKVANDDKDDVTVKVVSPDIETNSGLVHVLSVNHLFGF